METAYQSLPNNTQDSAVKQDSVGIVDLEGEEDSSEESDGEPEPKNDETADQRDSKDHRYDPAVHDIVFSSP